MDFCSPESEAVLSVRGEAETLEGTESLVIKCGVKGGRERALNWGIPV